MILQHQLSHRLGETIAGNNEVKRLSTKGSWCHIHRGIRIPHSSPSAKSNSRSDKRSCYRTSPNASVENDFRAFSTISITESCKQVRVHVSGKADRAEGTPPGYGYLTHHLPRKVTHARISDSATEQVLTLEIRGKKTQLYTLTLKCLSLSGRKKHTRT